jgi:ornithine carbamoyltransferase
MVDMIMIRNDSQKELEEFASYSKVPVINGLTDKFHPVQLMADYLTILEYGYDKDLVVAYVGDGNNMTHSWMMLAAKLGFELRIATPKGYEVDQDILMDAFEIANQSGAKIIVGHDPKVAIKDATVVTTDTWVSMGQEDEKEKRIKDFTGFMVDDNMMSLADDKAIFLHCLPAYRGYEVSESIFEKHSEIIFNEAQNRLHAQKAIMVYLHRNKDD